LKNFESEFEKRLDGVIRDARASAVFVYTELTIHQQAGLDRTLFETINRHAGFWNVIFGSLQSSGIIALGRMYDDDAQTLSLPKLLEYVETHPGIFSHSAFQTRKINSGMSPAMAAGMVENEPPFQLADLKPLRDEFDAIKKIWDKEFKPIRHEVFAHASRLTQQEIEELFSKTLVEELENLTVFPLRLTNLLWELYTNARPIRPYPVATRIPDVLARAPGKVISNLEHEHAVNMTVEFLENLKRLSPAPK
jgi:AbiU2